MEITGLSRYDRHCLEKLIGTTTEDRLIEESHVFTLSNGTEYTVSTESGVPVLTVPDPVPPVLRTEEERLDELTRP